MFEVYELQDKIEYFDDAVRMFWNQWGTQSNYKFYHDCMMHSYKTESDLPRFYIALQNKSIIGTYALLRNDLVAKLLEHAIRETEKKGLKKLYLCTDLDGYYEKCGWTHLTNGYIFNGDETKIYAASTFK